jgi:cytochrome P450
LFRTWVARLANRMDSDNLIVNFGLKKVLLVGSPDLSAFILAQYPRRAGFSTGTLKRSAMAFLAARALTISDDEDWRRRRAFNEAVLTPGRPHELTQHFVRATLRAFSAPIAGLGDLRSAMGRTMLGVVLGGRAPAELSDDVQALFGLVQNPVKRVLVAPWAYWRRARFYRALRSLWRARESSGSPTLLGIADRCAGELDATEFLEQIPHWMFTFTGSATDLLTRTLALISSGPALHNRARAEVLAVGPLDEGWRFAEPALLEACLLETAHLYPPVTRTFHRAMDGATVGDVRIPPGTEILHLFPPFSRADDGQESLQRRFDPDRWLQDKPPVCSFDPFLGGARVCPGRSLILLICKVALASLLVKHQVVIHSSELSASPLPAEFPRRGLELRVPSPPA